MKLETTGERMIESSYRTSLGGYVIYLLHAASYSFASPFCAGKRVLDLGCGSGYGAARIAEAAQSVDAVDVSDEAIGFARKTYPRDNLTFRSIAAGGPLPFPDQAYDVVLSFQVIEHVVDDSGYLREAARVLANDGVLIVITPDRTTRLLPGQRPWNRWHVREYDRAALERVVSESFDVRQSLGMNARRDIAEVELKRYRRMKWLMLPATLPIFPERVRRLLLDAIHRVVAVASALRPRGKGVESQPLHFDFGEETVTFEDSVSPSLNLVVVATPKRG